MTEPVKPSTLRSVGGHHFNVADAVEISLGELRARRVSDGQHVWIIAVIYHVGDPEQAMDSMRMDETNLIGPSNIHCMWCQQTYESVAPDSVCEA